MEPRHPGEPAADASCGPASAQQSVSTAKSNLDRDDPLEFPVCAESILTPLAYEAIVSVAYDADARVLRIAEPEEGDDQELSDQDVDREAYLDWRLPPIFRDRYDDPAFIAKFRETTLRVAQRIDYAHGAPVRFDTPAEEIAFFVAFEVSELVATGGLRCWGMTASNRLGVKVEIDAYYVKCRRGDRVEALYGLQKTRWPEASLSLAGLDAWHVDRWFDPFKEASRESAP